MITDPIALLLLLIVGHALADYPLQGDFISKFKNPNEKLNGEVVWPWILGSHASIHGVFVGVLTGSILLGLAETVAHWFIDLLKCKGQISFAEDQTLHLICKVFWYFIWFIYIFH